MNSRLIAAAPDLLDALSELRLPDSLKVRCVKSTNPYLTTVPPLGRTRKRIAHNI